MAHFRLDGQEREIMFRGRNGAARAHSVFVTIGPFIDIEAGVSSAMVEVYSKQIGSTAPVYLAGSATDLALLFREIANRLEHLETVRIEVDKPA